MAGLHADEPKRQLVHAATRGSVLIKPPLTLSANPDERIPTLTSDVQP